MFRTAAILVLAGGLAAGCHRKDTEQGSSESGKTTAAVTSKTPSVIPSAEVQRITNPDKREPYSGPTGSVVGVVRVSGDTSPPLPLGTAKLPRGKCFAAHEMYKSLFREGPGRTLADVLVAVTQYDGYLPVPAERPVVEAKDCAFDTRTVALMFGQPVAVKNVGNAAVTPQLIPVKTQALLVAIPGGEPIELYPHKVGLHKLVDRSHGFTYADVYVVSFPTVDVTGLDGRFEITGVPVGEVKISALLPATGKTSEQKVTVKPNQKTEVSLEIPYSASEAAPTEPAPEPAASGAADPAASGAESASPDSSK